MLQITPSTPASMHLNERAIGHEDIGFFPTYGWGFGGFGHGVDSTSSTTSTTQAPSTTTQPETPTSPQTTTVTSVNEITSVAPTTIFATSTPLTTASPTTPSSTTDTNASSTGVSSGTQTSPTSGLPSSSFGTQAASSSSASATSAADHDGSGSSSTSSGTVIIFTSTYPGSTVTLTASKTENAPTGAPNGAVTTSSGAASHKMSAGDIAAVCIAAVSVLALSILLWLAWRRRQARTDAQHLSDDGRSTCPAHSSSSSDLFLPHRCFRPPIPRNDIERDD